ncbi:MAG: hypothetical protein ACYC9Q_09090 [Bacillota bacterium]
MDRAAKLDLGERVLERCSEAIAPKRAAGLGKLLKMFIAGEHPVAVGLSNTDFLRAIGRGIAAILLEEYRPAGLTITVAVEPAYLPQRIHLRLVPNGGRRTISYDIHLDIVNARGAFATREALAAWLFNKYQAANARFGQVLAKQETGEEGEHMKFEIWQVSLLDVPPETIPTGIFPVDLYQKVFEGGTQRHGLDGIFEQFQRGMGGLLDDLERRGEAGNVLHSMCVGDIIATRGRVFRCSPVGWDDITAEWEAARSRRAPVPTTPEQGGSHLAKENG